MSGRSTEEVQPSASALKGLRQLKEAVLFVGVRLVRPNAFDSGVVQHHSDGHVHHLLDEVQVRGGQQVVCSVHAQDCDTGSSNLRGNCTSAGGGPT